MAPAPESTMRVPASRSGWSSPSSFVALRIRKKSFLSYQAHTYSTYDLAWDYVCPSNNSVAHHQRRASCSISQSFSAAHILLPFASSRFSRYPTNLVAIHMPPVRISPRRIYAPWTDAPYQTALATRR
jgi:hypothetical protein